MFRKMVFIIAVVSVLALPVQAGGRKKLICWGRGCPTTNFMRDNIADMEKAPFDGVVFFLTSDASRQGGINQRPVWNVPEATGDFSWQCWGKRAFTKAELQRETDNLKSTKFKKFSNNFARFNVTPGDVDWFDSFDAIVNNARVAGWVTKEGGVKGVMFDVETYSSPIWTYSKQMHAANRSFEEYAAQVRLRGCEVMRAFQSDYNDITIFFSIASSFICMLEQYPVPFVAGPNSFSMTNNDPRKLRYVGYGLLPAFIDGMVEVAGPRVKFVDGSEFTYLYRDKSEFVSARDAFAGRCLSFVSEKEKYKQKFGQAIALWIDWKWREPGGWNPKEFTNNFWQPDDLKNALVLAFEASDEYVWLYDEWQRWWQWGEGYDVPFAYVQAVAEARKIAGLN